MKQKNFKKKNYINVKGQEFIYHMNKKMFEAINETRSKDEKLTPKTYVKNVVNKEFGLKGTVVDIVLHERV